MDITIDALIQHFQLAPHPEGGFFRETYRDRGVIPHNALPKRFAGERNYSTAIYFLLPEGQRSRLHRITADEAWHFYLGDPLVVVEIGPNGTTRETTLGSDVLAGQHVQHVVPAGHWFGAYPATGSRFSLVGCTVAPGFDFADFTMGERAALLQQFPQARDVIERLG